MSLASKLAEERRGRLIAERLLEQKQAELAAANRQLGRHAQALSEEIVETRAEVATVRDENQRVKSDLSAAHHKVEAAERRLWHSVQTISDGFACFDCDSTLIAANRAYLSIFDGVDAIAPGVDYATIVRTMTDQGIVNTGDLSRTAWQAMMLERWKQDAPTPLTIRLWNDEYVRLVDKRNAAGDMVSVGLNITSTVQTEAELEEARAAAESVSRAKSAFLANMSHEIRTPMNGVVGMADLLAETGLTEEQRLYVDTIRNSGDALLTIINDVLDYSKIEADKLALHPEPFDLEQCIHEVMMLLQPTARDKRLKLLVDYDLFMPSRFVGDPGRVRQVLTNLMGNAVKFTQRGHVLVRVTGVSRDDGPSQINITVEDTGIGIPETQVEHIFGEFNQVDASRNREFDGTGLGLAISRRLVQMMGGEMWLTSEEGVGSCFGFRVHLDAAGETALMPPQLPDALRRVLVVDDVQANLMILERQLERLGLGAVCCDSAAAALRALEAGGIDLVLTDHHMPDQTGLDLVRDMRLAGRQEPVILLSSNPGHADRDPARGELYALMQKPVRRDDLLRMLETVRPSVLNSDIHTGTRVMRILAAEDNKTNQLVLRKMLAPLNIVLEVAETGAEAVARYDIFRPDLIFMDMSMPVMDGRAATQAIRAREQETGRHVPIIALTANVLDDEETLIKAVGLDDYLTKPLRKEVLIDRIAALCPRDVAPPVADQDNVA